MNCYLCDNEASQRCPRCGNPYCGDHGEDPSAGSAQALCADCLNPVNAAPSGTFFRASLLAMLVGSVLALWLLIRPPGLPGDSSEIVIPQASPQPTTPPLATPTPAGGTATPAATPKPTATAKPTAVPTPTAGPIEYTVVDGDTWYGIAEAYGVDAESLAAYNSYTLEDLLPVGEVLTIPQ